VTARSPYVLEDQNLNSVIRVKAIDKAGNEYIATLVPEESLRGVTTQNMIIFALLGLLSLLALIVLFAIVIKLLKRRRIKMVSQEESNKNTHDSHN
jgi:flagellar biosynthesis/type III secretory pathway M-ring protein FliF/YscJ